MHALYRHQLYVYVKRWCTTLLLLLICQQQKKNCATCVLAALRWCATLLGFQMLL